jgi:hypothetical protein
LADPDTFLNHTLHSFVSERKMRPSSISFGSLIKSSTIRKSYWEAVGQMRILFIEKLAPAIRDYLEQCLEPSLDELHWSMYMYGYNAETASPYLIFSSTNENIRKKAKELVKESGILKNAPAVKLRDTRYIPGLNAPVELLGDHVRVQNSDAAQNSADSAFFYCMPSENNRGVSLFVTGLPNEGGMRRATAGGIICVGSRFFYLTVSHVSEQNERRVPEQGGNRQILSEIGDQEDDSEEEEEGGVADLHLNDSISADGRVISRSSSYASEYSTGSESLTVSSHEILPIARLHNEISLFQVGRSLQSSTARFIHSRCIALGPADRIGSRMLDYQLIEIHNELLIRPNIWSAPRIPLSNTNVDKVSQIGNEDCDVAVLTVSRGVLRGILCATPRYMSLPNATTMRKTFSLKLNGRIQPGDCGAWVVDTTSGHLYGHIFGGISGTGTVYMLSAAEIFDDIQAKSAQPVGLPSTTGEHTQSHPRVPNDEPYRGPEVCQMPDSSGLQETRILGDQTVSKVNRETLNGILDNMKCPGDNSDSSESLGNSPSIKLTVTKREKDILGRANFLAASKNHEVSDISGLTPGENVKPDFLEHKKAQTTFPSELLPDTHPQSYASENKVSQRSHTLKSERRLAFYVPSLRSDSENKASQRSHTPKSERRFSFHVPSLRRQTSKHRDAAQDQADEADEVINGRS